jgi:transposase-like protein
VEDLLAKRGLDISYETVRRWVLKFRTDGHPQAAGAVALGEVVVRIAGKWMYLWRAVHEGDILDVLVQRRPDKRAALKRMRKPLRKQGFA